MELLTTFFERYLAAWTAPTQIAEFYNEPFMAARMGTIRLNQARQDTERFFEEVLAKYRAKGFAKAKLLTMDTVSLGANSSLATVRWAYQDQEGKTLWEWTFSYNLYKSDGVWKIVLQTLHDS